MTEVRQLLTEYVATGSETAFREVVDRYVDLVYSAAVRLVNGDTHMAQDITQTVFADLARKAKKLSPEVMLGGWLHRHACYVAANVMRGERRRRARERRAVEMNAIEDHSAENLARVAPVLDEAINELGAEDRAAILLRFFEQHDFRSVGAAMGSNEETARKRVNRALDKLHSLLTKRGVALSVGTLGTMLTGQAITAAPAGLAASVCTIALTGTAAGGGTTITILKIMSMSKIKIGVVSVALATGIAVPWVIQHQTRSELRRVNDSLREQQVANERLLAANAELSGLLESRTNQVVSAPPPTREMLRLRGEVGRLNQELASARAAAVRSNAPSPISDMASNPEIWKMIRSQQKTGMSALYKDFTNQLSLTPEKAQQFADVLADHIMTNIQHVTVGLQEQQSYAQMDRVFAQEEAVLHEKVLDLLGPEGLAQYLDYTRNLASRLTADEFKSKFEGDSATKAEKARQLRELMQDETQRVLSAAGLPADYQTIPVLDFRNIAWENAGERTVQVLDTIYAGVLSRANTFLSPDELAKFSEHRTNSIAGSRMALTVNRKMMSPVQQ